MGLQNMFTFGSSGDSGDRKRSGCGGGGIGLIEEIMNCTNSTPNGIIMCSMRAKKGVVLLWEETNIMAIMKCQWQNLRGVPVPIHIQNLCELCESLWGLGGVIKTQHHTLFLRIMRDVRDHGVHQGGDLWLICCGRCGVGGEKCKGGSDKQSKGDGEQHHDTQKRNMPHCHQMNLHTHTHKKIWVGRRARLRSM